MQPLQQLHYAIAAVCPIYGVSVGSMDDRTTWEICFHEDATQDQRDAAAAVLLVWPDVPKTGGVDVIA